MNIAQHELDHALGLGVALVLMEVEPELYDAARVLIFADPEDGGLAIADPSELHPATQAQALALAALGPLGGVDGAASKLIGCHP